MVCRWRSWFLEGRQNVHDDERSGSPVTATDNAAVAAVRNVVEADRRVTIDEIMIRLPPGIEIRRSSIGTIMSDVLNFLKVCTRWVPRLLLENHKQQRMEAARAFLEMHQRDGDQLFSRIVTGDKSWVHHSTPETKRQSMVWKKPEESAPKKAKVTISAGKVMAMENFKWEIFTHPPYSPELAPSDFHLYPALKWHLGGKHFANDDEVQAEANYLATKTGHGLVQQWYLKIATTVPKMFGQKWKADLKKFTEKLEELCNEELNFRTLDKNLEKFSSNISKAAKASIPRRRRKDLKVRSKRSPGDVLIFGQMIKHFGDKAKNQLLRILNISWQTGKLPKYWKISIIVPILKPNKDAKESKNYRPIALISILCKITERIILSRLIVWLTNNNKINFYQTDYRSRHCTPDQPFYFCQSIIDSFQEKPPKKTTAVFLDMTSASIECRGRNYLKGCTASELRKVGRLDGYLHMLSSTFPWCVLSKFLTRTWPTLTARLTSLERRICPVQPCVTWWRSGVIIIQVTPPIMPIQNIKIDITNEAPVAPENGWEADPSCRGVKDLDRADRPARRIGSSNFSCIPLEDKGKPEDAQIPSGSERMPNNTSLDISNNSLAAPTNGPGKSPMKQAASTQRESTRLERIGRLKELAEAFQDSLDTIRRGRKIGNVHPNILEQCFDKLLKKHRSALGELELLRVEKRNLEEKILSRPPCNGGAHKGKVEGASVQIPTRDEKAVPPSPPKQPVHTRNSEMVEKKRKKKRVKKPSAKEEEGRTEVTAGSKEDPPRATPTEEVKEPPPPKKIRAKEVKDPPKATKTTKPEPPKVWGLLGRIHEILYKEYKEAQRNELGHFGPKGGHHEIPPGQEEVEDRCQDVLGEGLVREREAMVEGQNKEVWRFVQLNCALSRRSSEELDRIIKSDRPHVILVQEMYLEDDGRMGLDTRYSFFSSESNKAALLVRGDSCLGCGSWEEAVAVQIEAADLKLICLSTYIPPQDNDLGVVDLVIGQSLEISNVYGESTFATENGENIIDFSLARTSRMRRLRWEMDPTDVSDHILIRFKTSCEVEPPSVERVLRYSIRGLNLERFRRRFACTLGDRLAGAVDRISINSMVNELHQDITNPWWNEELKIERKRVRAMRKLFQNSTGEERVRRRIAFQKVLAGYKRHTKREKRKHWREQCKTVLEINPYGLPYRAVSGKIRCSANLRLLEGEDGFKTQDLKDPGPHLGSELRKREPEDEISLTTCGLVDPLFSENKVKLVAFKFGNRKSPGPDGIDNTVVKALVRMHLSLLARLFNRCLDTGTFPEAWKVARVVLLEKSGRKGNSPNDYRPLSLLACLGKVLDSLLAQRLKHWLEGAWVLLVALDIDGAFNSMNWNKLMRNLMDMGCPDNLCSLVRDFLRDRRISLGFGGLKLERNCARGCPQGSCCGPILWNLLVNTVFQEELPEGARLVLYADDQFLIIEAASRAKAEKCVETSFQIPSNWAHDSGLKFNVSKTKALSFKSREIRTKRKGIKWEHKPAIRMEDGGSPPLTVYTDGSSDLSLSNRGAGINIILQDGTHIKIKEGAGQISSNFTCELTAIWKALDVCLNQPSLHKAEGILIYSDSISALEAIQKGNTKITQKIHSLLTQLEPLEKNCILQRIPAHVGIGGNEMAFELAKEARKLGQRKEQMSLFDADALLLAFFNPTNPRVLVIFPCMQNFPLKRLRSNQSNQSSTNIKRFCTRVPTRFSRQDIMESNKTEVKDNGSQSREGESAGSVTTTAPLADVVLQLAALLTQAKVSDGAAASLSPFDGTYSAHQFFQAFDRKMDDAHVDAPEKLLRLPSYLARQPLELFRKLRLAGQNYFQVRQILLDLYPESSEASFAKYFAMKLTGQADLETYYREKTAMGLQLGLPQEVILETLTEGLPTADPRVQYVNGTTPRGTTAHHVGSIKQHAPMDRCMDCASSAVQLANGPKSTPECEDSANGPKQTRPAFHAANPSRRRPSRAEFSRLSVPCLRIPQVKIPTNFDKIITIRPYRVPICDQQEIRNQVQQMLENGIIEQSFSPFSSPVTLVTKRDKTKRFCIDYRKVNELINSDVHPLPRIEDILDRLAQAKYFSTADISSAYWQVPIHPDSRPLLAFATLEGLYQPTRLPFGLKTSPQIYERAMSQVLQRHGLDCVAHYFDDFIIFSNTLEEHQNHLRQFFAFCEVEKLQLNFAKCEFFKQSIYFLGYTVTAGTTTPLTRNTDVIHAIKQPHNRKTLQSFLGAVNVYNKFIPEYARLRAPLNNLLKKDVVWVWDEACQKAFIDLKENLTQHPILHLYKEGLPCQVYCDASTLGIAGILKQVHPDGNVYPVQYFSRTLRPHERNYSISELECLAIVESVEKFRIYLMGRKFTIFSDHHALQWLKTIKNPSGRLFRWSLRLSNLLSRNPFCGFLDASLIKTHQPSPSRESSLTIDRNGLHTVSRKGVTKIIIPKTLVQQLLQTVHAQYNHPGISQMSRLISTQYYWPGMSKDIKQKVKTCPTCQLTKRPLGPTYGELSQPPEAKEPFDLLSLDTIAGFAKYGNTKIYLHIVVDHFSRYAWTFPSKSTSINTYQQVLKRVLQDGSPKRLLTDRASAFTSPKFSSFLLNRNIHPLLTTSNNPQTNGLCERLNATLTGKLRLLHFENPKIAWTKLVKRVTIIYNNTPYSTTGFPPIYLMFGVLPPEISNHSTPYPDIDRARKIAHTRTQYKHIQDKNI
ncbi:hypothetical protein LAZ67_18001387 [Cordylochernes scorpioides]|uniref:RNA-directed DNA polymerase n=1 Tax=Cordylochernes scorpioides TaxID=51811 RepID=A0ABY6LJG5_9ARAC|nr:hypothetical protein LAZ67_18001387 [Cordylochernes scorpioides]